MKEYYSLSDKQENSVTIRIIGYLKYLQEFEMTTEHSNWSINIHISFQVHSTDRVFQCPQCEKGFKELRTLRLHLKIHNAEYPEQCNVCQKVLIHD